MVNRRRRWTGRFGMWSVQARSTSRPWHTFRAQPDLLGVNDERQSCGKTAVHAVCGGWCCVGGLVESVAGRRIDASATACRREWWGCHDPSGCAGRWWRDGGDDCGNPGSRAGAKTLLVERGTQLGGTTTTGGVSFPGLFDAWGKQIIAGIGWELVKDSVELDGGSLPDFSKVPARHWQNQVRVNQFLYAILAEEKCEQAGVQLAYYEFPRAIQKTADGWLVECIGFGTRRRVVCKQIVDCTGGAEVCEQAAAHGAWFKVVA